MDQVTELLPCPFCGATDKHLRTVKEYTVYIDCSICGARGPICAGRVEAGAMWNRRIVDEHEDDHAHPR